MSKFKFALLFFAVLTVNIGCKQRTKSFPSDWSTITITSEERTVITIDHYTDTSIVNVYHTGSFFSPLPKNEKIKIDTLKTYFTATEKDTIFHLAKAIISEPVNTNHAGCTEFVGDLKLVIDYGQFKEPGSFRQSGEYSGVCKWDTLSDKTLQLNKILSRKIKWRTK